MEDFNWNKFFNPDNKIAVSCCTEEEAIDFVNKACRNKEFKKRWCYYGNTESDTDWHCLRENTCYFGNACFGHFDNANAQSYEIVKWAAFMPKNVYNLKEKYLRTGYIIKACNEQIYIVLIYENTVHLLNIKSHDYAECSLDDYDDKLSNHMNSDFTVIAIYNRIKTLEDIEILPKIIWEE